MNIFWILTDSICNYERPDLHSLLPIYKELEKGKDGFYFKDAVSQFPSTNLSVLSFLTGKYPYNVFPDYYRSIENLPSLELDNNIYPLKKEGYNIHSIIFGKEQVIVLQDILNPYYREEMYQGDHWLDAKEVYDLFIKKVENITSKEKNLFFIFFRPSDPQADLYVRKIIGFLKRNNFWNNSLFILNSDHGYYDKNLYQKTKLLHFDDIHQSSMQPALFIRIPPILTKVKPRTIYKRVYLIDILETILDYLNIETNHDRQSISFKPLIEKNIDVNNERTVRGDCYLMFQSIQKTMITKGTWKLLNDNGKFSLFNLAKDKLEKKDVKDQNPEIFDELYQFYLDSESKAYDNFKLTLDSLYNHSVLRYLKSKTFLIPDQFPPQLVKFLREKLKKYNKIITQDDIINKEPKKIRNVTTILFLNRLTGYGLKKLIKRYKKISKSYLILNTELSDVSHQWNKTGYLRFVIKSIIARRNQLLQRWKEILVWILYFPLYFNKHMRRFYK
ncbi:MAG: hypothetical protein ACFE9I_13880 [Candidatus Hermodarchaeota archaeon]